MRILNITNGDGAAKIIRTSTVPGDVLSWRDPMHHGPFPEGLKFHELRSVRARYFAGSEYDLNVVEHDFRLRDEHLEAVPSYDSVVLWFEHDLLDQLQILQILDWFANSELIGIDLEIICINSFEGKENFRGIGELDPIQMASLSDKRVTVTSDMLKLAQAGWFAFRSSNPIALLDFIETDLSVFPFLKSALLRHLEEYPSTKNGINRTEQQIISLVSQGVSEPMELFLKNMDFETALYIGDWRTFSTIDRLCKAKVFATNTDMVWSPQLSQNERSNFLDQKLNLTDLGQDIYTGITDAFDVLKRDEWLGGVHIKSGTSMWTWDTTAQELYLRK